MAPLANFWPLCDYPARSKFICTCFLNGTELLGLSGYWILGWVAYSTRFGHKLTPKIVRSLDWINLRYMDCWFGLRSGQDVGVAGLSPFDPFDHWWRWWLGWWRSWCHRGGFFASFSALFWRGRLTLKPFWCGAFTSWAPRFVVFRSDPDLFFDLGLRRCRFRRNLGLKDSN